MRTRLIHNQCVEMQMGPMIDMVFLLLVFFMVTAKPIKQESDIDISLPGTISQEEAIDFPDELQIIIQSNGQVIVNEMPTDSPTSPELPSLLSTLLRVKQSADANKTEALVTINPEDSAQHQRIVDVLNTCAKAQITGVTFASSDEEDY